MFASLPKFCFLSKYYKTLRELVPLNGVKPITIALAKCFGLSVLEYRHFCRMMSLKGKIYRVGGFCMQRNGCFTRTV